MSDVKEIIVLDDDEDEEEPPRPTKAKASACNSSKQTNGKQEGSSSSQPSKAEAISAENKKLFNEFVDYCSKLTSEHPEVISFLQGRYVKANPSYLSSVEFRNCLGRCLSRVQTKKSKVFVYINELCTALKANSQKRKVSLKTQALQPVAAAEKVDEPKENDAEAEDPPVKKTGSKRQIRYLENLLRTYAQEINKLQERELTLEDLEDEDSTYIQESRLKRKLLRIFEKLCELKDCSSLTGRVIEQRILYRGTRYPEINRRLEKFINSSRDLFPDYGDILRLVERANEKHSLGLSRKQMQSMSQDAFRELGNKLQDRRHLDMIYNFGCHLTDPYKSVNDPAQQDISLSRRLRENRNMAMSRLDDVIKKYAQLQDDNEDDYRKVTRQGSERVRQSSSSEASEEEEESSQDSETDIEEELEESNKMPESEEGENEEEEIPTEQDNEADQKMDMASVGEEGVEKDKGGSEDNDNIMDEQEEATEQESSPVSTSSSHDKDSLNTPMESEAEAQPSASPDLPASNGSPAKDESDDEHNEEQEAGVTATNTGDQVEEEDDDEEHDNPVLSPVDDGSEEVNEDADESLHCKENTEQQKGTEESLSNLLMSSEDKENSEQDGEDGTEPRDDLSCEGDDGGIDSDPPGSPVLQEESCTEEPSERRESIDSEDESVGEKPDTAENSDDDDDYNDPVDDAGTSGDERSIDSPVVEHQDANTNVHTEAGDLDRCENETNCELSPFGSSNGVHLTSEVRNISINRLKLKKEGATHRDSLKPKKTEEDSPPPNRKRKNMSSENCAKNKWLTMYNGKKYTEDLRERNCKRAKLDCSYTSLSSSSDPDSEIEEGDTPGLMMTCSPRETPTKPNKKSHVSTQCDPDEVIVLSD